MNRDRESRDKGDALE